MHGHEVLAHMFNEMRRNLLGPGMAKGEGLGGGLLAFLRRDESRLFHPFKHMLLALLRPFRIFVGRIMVRGLGKSGQQRGLGESQLRQVFPEIRQGRGAHSVGALPEIDLVQVHLQDLLLAQDQLHLVCQDQFLEFSPVGSLRRQKQRAGELLGNRAGPLHFSTAPQIGPDRPQNADDIQPRVFEEPRVLHRDHRLGQVLRNVGQRDQDAPFNVKLADDLAVVRVDTTHEAGLVFLQGIE